MQVFANNLVVSLDVGVNTTATTFALTTGDGAKLPTITSPDFLLLTLAKRTGSVETDWEIVKVTAVATDNLTVVRNHESTSVLSWVAGDTLHARVTAGSMSNVVQVGDNKDAVVAGIELKDYAESFASPNDAAGTTTVNFVDGGTAHLTLGQNTTLAFTNPPATGRVGSMNLIIDQDGTGGWTVTMPAAVTKGTLDLNLGVSKRTIAVLVTIDGGTSFTLMTSFKEA